MNVIVKDCKNCANFGRKDEKKELLCSRCLVRHDPNGKDSDPSNWRSVFEAAENVLISVEGYKAFRGTMRITPKAAVPAFELHGDWLYKPDTGCWYGKGSSFPEDICTIMEVE